MTDAFNDKIESPLKRKPDENVNAKNPETEDLPKPDVDGTSGLRRPGSLAFEFLLRFLTFFKSFYIDTRICPGTKTHTTHQRIVADE